MLILIPSRFQAALQGENEQTLNHEAKSFTGWVSTPSSLAKSHFESQTVKSGFIAIDVGRKKGWTEVVVFMAIGLGMVLFGGLGLLRRK